MATTRPIRGPSEEPSSRRTWTTRSGWDARVPRFTVTPKSVDRVIRYCAGSKVPTTRVPNQAVSERRPLRRRSVTIARPARVRIRSRNPCTRARRRVFGWNVRLPLATAVSPCCVWPPPHHPLSWVSMMAVGKLMRLARNRRGSHGPSIPSTDDQSGFAAVPPTFGRLFEGTDVLALGQTCGFTPGSTVKIPSHPDNLRGQCATGPPLPGTLTSMLQNGWHSEIKLLASANAFSDREGRRQPSEDAGSTPSADIATLVSQCEAVCESNPRSVAVRLPGEDDRPVHICG